MGYNSRYAQKRAFELVPETCPKVDEAFSDAAHVVKAQTNARSDALVDTLEELMSAEAIIEDLERKVIELKDEIQEMKGQAT